MIEPLIIRALKERVLEWKKSQGGVIIIKPSSRSFTSLEVSTIPIGVFGFERITQFVCALDVVSEGDMNEMWRKVYRELKRLECELIWKGRINRQPAFVNSRSLNPLIRSVPGFSPSSDLINRLNSNSSIIDLIKIAKPDNLAINLFSSPQKITDNVEPTKYLIDFYNSPQKVTWLIIATKMLEFGLSYPKIVNSIFSLFEEISKALKEITEKYYNYLASRAAK